MQIEINNNLHSCDEETTVKDIAEKFDLNKPGTAVAVNMKVISRDNWSNFKLSENDKLIVINATCGG